MFSSYKYEQEVIYLSKKLQNFAKNPFNGAIKSNKRGRRIKAPARDPLNSSYVIDCPECENRFNIPQDIWVRIREGNASYALEDLKHVLSAHACVYTYLGLSGNDEVYYFDPGNDTFVFICADCWMFAPFPLVRPNSYTDLTWRHACTDNQWALPAEQEPTIRWHPRANIWVGKIPFHNKLWEDLGKLPRKVAKRDVKTGVWLFDDSEIKNVVLLCKTWLEETIWHESSKKKMRRGQISQKAKHAEVILCSLTTDLLKRFYRLAVVELHPDKGGDNDKFQAFQSAWNSFMDRN